MYTILYRGSESSTQWHVKWPCSQWANLWLHCSSSGGCMTTLTSILGIWVKCTPTSKSCHTLPKVSSHLKAFLHPVCCCGRTLLCHSHSEVMFYSSLCTHPASSCYKSHNFLVVVQCSLVPAGPWMWQVISSSLRQDVKEDSWVHDYMIASFSPGKDELWSGLMICQMWHWSLIPLQWSTGLQQGLESLPMWWSPVRSWCKSLIQCRLHMCKLVGVCLSIGPSLCRYWLDSMHEKFRVNPYYP